MFLFGPPNIEKMKARSDVQGLVKALGYKRNVVVMMDASKALSEIGLPAIQPLVSILKKQKHKARTMAVMTLEHIGASAVEPLITVLNEQSDSRTSSIIAAILIRIGGPAVEPLIRAFQAGNMGIGSILGRMPGVRARDALIEALEHGGACLSHEPYGERKLLIATAHGILPRDADNGIVRLVAIESLSAIRDPEAIQALIRAVERKSETGLVRLRAAELLARYGAADPALPSIIDLLDDKSPFICHRAVTLLGKIGDPQARGILTHLLQNNDPLIREVATEALKRLKS